MELIAACAMGTWAGGRKCSLLPATRALGYTSPVPKGMERRNSSVERKTAPDSQRFFCARARFIFGREGDGYKTFGEEVRLAQPRFLTSRPPCRMRVETFRQGFVSLVEERFMSQSVQGASGAITFTFSTQALRVILRNSEPWFVAADVAEALSIGRTDDAVRRLDDDEKGTDTVRTPGGQQEMTIINESGLYSLILTSRKPEAKKFKKWVTSEVLPAIRKTGRYEAPQAPAQASEHLSANDMRNITRLVWIIARGFRFEGSWRNGIWFYLRRALNLTSPQPYCVDHLPRMAQELQALAAASEQVHTMMVAIEQEAARRIFRKGEAADLVVADLKAQGLQRLDAMQLHMAALPAYLQKDVSAITNRTPNGYYHHDAVEQVGYFESKGAAV